MSRKFVIIIYALFPPILLAWKVDSANVYTFRMYEKEGDGVIIMKGHQKCPKLIGGKTQKSTCPWNQMLNNRFGELNNHDTCSPFEIFLINVGQRHKNTHLSCSCPKTELCCKYICNWVWYFSQFHKYWDWMVQVVWHHMEVGTKCSFLQEPIKY